MTSSNLLKETVDHYLGDGEKRFFSTGYRRVGYHFGPVEVSARREDDIEVTTTVGLTYPIDWSKKTAGVDQRPHLSTVDAILLGVQLAELCLVAGHRPSPDAHRAMWVRRLTIRAGRNPQESLGELPLTAVLRSTKPSATAGGLVSVVDSQVGPMRVRIEIEHRRGEVHLGHATYDSPDDLLGPAASRYYGTGFTRAGHRIDDLVVDTGALRATGTVDLRQADADQGIEGAYSPAPTSVDAFVTGLQLAQILLYELDSMRRSDSNTLWMRSTVIEIDQPRRALSEVLPLTTSLSDVSLVDMDGGTWRTATIAIDLAGVAITCAVTHALPTAN